MMRPLNLFLSLALASLGGAALGQNLDAKITYTTPVASIDQVLADLTRIGGVTLRSGTQTKNDVLCLRLKDATVQEVMDRIAEVLDAEWRPSDGGYLLTRTGASELKVQREEAAQRGNAIEAAIRKMLAEVDQTPKLTEEEMRKAADEMRREFESMTRGARGNAGPGLQRAVRGLREMSQKQPGGRAIVRLLAGINPAELGAMGPGTRVVFSTRTTPMQKPLPGNAQQIIDRFLEEQRTLDTVVGDTIQPGGGTNPVTMFLGQQRQRLQSGRPGKSILVVSRLGVAEGLQCQLTVFEAQTGEALTTGMLTLSVDEPGQPLAARTDEKPIPMTEASMQFAKLAGSNQGALLGAATSFLALASGDASDVDFSFITNPGGSGKPAEVTKEWRDRILDPVAHDPLSTVPSDIFIGIAEAKNVNLVANLPDAMLLPASRRVSQGEIRPTEALALARGPWGLDVRESDGWMEIEPKMPFTARNERTDRGALGKMLKTVVANGRLNLDDLANYAVTSDAANPLGGVDYFYLRLLDPATADRQFATMFSSNREMLKFYGLLSQAQRNTLFAGRPMQLSALNQKQRELLHSMVYNSMDGPRVENARGGPGGGMAAFLGGGSLQSERTEAMPNGVPNTGLLTVRSENEPAVLASDASGTVFQYLTAEALGRQRAIRENPQIAQFLQSDANFDRFRLGQQSTYRFRFEFSRNISLLRQLTDARIDSGTPAVSFDELPREFRRRVEQGAGRIRGGDRVANPPPPMP